jgi:hypothetical protein
MEDPQDYATLATAVFATIAQIQARLDALQARLAALEQQPDREEASAFHDL